jgi:polyribonucleotide nucleotidyltransferase
LQAAFEKRSSYLRRRKRRRNIYAKVKEASYDKNYAIASKGSSKQERTAFDELKKEEVKALFTEEELRKRRFSFKIFKKTNKEAVRNVTLDLGTFRRKKTTEIRDIWCKVITYHLYTDQHCLHVEKLKHWQQQL